MDAMKKLKSMGYAKDISKLNFKATTKDRRMKEVIDCWTYLEKNHPGSLTFVKDPSPESITLMVDDNGDLFGDSLKVTIEDVVEYYVSQAGNTTSGIRTLAGRSGDWRPIDGMAAFCLDYFTAMNAEKFDEAAGKRGLKRKKRILN